MKEFESVELEPIEGPIAPEPTFDWKQMVLLPGLGVLFVAALTFTGIYFLLKVRRKRQALEPIQELRQIRRALRSWESDNKSGKARQPIDLDVWMALLTDYLAVRNAIVSKSVSLQELSEQCLASGLFDKEWSNSLQILVALAEPYLYGGSSNASDLESIETELVKLFRGIILLEQQG